MNKPTKRNREAEEFASLTREQQAVYEEAVRCGAEHDDAMDVAENGQ